MSYVLKDARVYKNGKFVLQDVFLSISSKGSVSFVFDSFFPMDEQTRQLNNYFLFPGLVDVHVHLREPGFSYKETIAAGTAAAARGGYTTVCTMPNLNPVPDSLPALQRQLDIINRDARIQTLPYAAITHGQSGARLSDMDALAPYVAGFSDDGRGVQNDELMLTAMQKAKSLNKLIVAHCEDESLLRGGYVHDGDYAKAHGHRGICSESEWRQVERDLALVRRTGCGYHVCHVSTKESVALIRTAKAQGLNVTCETAPHYLTLTDQDLQEDGRFKMNPPLRAQSDRQALIEGVCDGTIDMIATDHAPHSQQEKSRGLEKSAFGVVGLETAFAVLYTKLVKPGVIPLEKLIELMSTAPARRFHINNHNHRALFDLEEKFIIDPDKFLSKGRATPYAGETVQGRCMLTTMEDIIVWQDSSIKR